MNVVRLEREPVHRAHRPIILKGQKLAGPGEFARLERKYNVESYVEECLRSETYNNNHRLMAGLEYPVGFMPINEWLYTDAVRARGIVRHPGYAEPPAGFATRIRWLFSDENMRAMGAKYIMIPHSPIMDAKGYPRILCIEPDRRIRAVYSGPCCYPWEKGGFAAFHYINPNPPPAS